MALLIQIISTALMLTSAYFWIRGGLWMSFATMQQLAAPQWDSNPAVVRSLISQRCDSSVTFALLVFGQALTIWAYYAPSKPLPFVKSWLAGTLIFLSTCLAAYTIGNYTSRTLEREFVKRPPTAAGHS